MVEPRCVRSDAVPDRRQRRLLRRAVRSTAFVVWMFATLHASAATDPPAVSTGFVEGYATALLERTHGVRSPSVTLDGSVLVVRLEREPAVALDKLTRGLLEIRGVEHVRIEIGDRLALEASAIAPPVPAEAADGEGPTAEESSSNGPSNGWDIFPTSELFDPLLADPRWPRFSASHRWYLDDDELERVAAVSFGETFALIRSPEHDWGQSEIVLQAAVYSVFDLEASSFDLVNSDFLVGFGASHHLGDFTALLRIYHQSSHLGDEFLLRNRVDRVNLSFEVVDLLVSFEPWRWLRLYGGAGLLVHREPALDRGITQVGVELTSPVAFARGYIRPVASVDLQHREESDWRTDVSLRAGVQLEHPVLDGRQLQLIAELYDGRSPNGQFFERRLRTIGLGVFLDF